jgi:hypothetical protein
VSPVGTEASRERPEEAENGATHPIEAFPSLLGHGLPKAVDWTRERCRSISRLRLESDFDWRTDVVVFKAMTDQTRSSLVFQRLRRLTEVERVFEKLGRHACHLKPIGWKRG